MRKLAQISLGKAGLATLSAVVTWLLAYGLYNTLTVQGTYRTTVSNVANTLQSSLTVGSNSVWQHLSYTLFRASLVALISIIAAAITGPALKRLGSKPQAKILRASLLSVLDTWRAIPITMIFVLLAFSIDIGAEIMYVLVPIPVIYSVLASSVIIAIEGRSKFRQHYYENTFRAKSFVKLTLPELFFAIKSDVRQAILYAVLLVVVLEYIQSPQSGKGIGTYYFQLFAAPPSPELVFAQALPPLIVVAVVAALIMSVFDFFDARVKSVNQ